MSWFLPGTPQASALQCLQCLNTSRYSPDWPHLSKSSQLGASRCDNSFCGIKGIIFNIDAPNSLVTRAISLICLSFIPGSKTLFILTITPSSLIFLIPLSCAFINFSAPSSPSNLLPFSSITKEHIFFCILGSTALTVTVMVCTPASTIFSAFSASLNPFVLRQLIRSGNSFFTNLKVSRA